MVLSCYRECRQSVLLGLLLMFCILLMTGCSDSDRDRQPDKGLVLIDSFEGGDYYLSPNQLYPVLNLKGDWHAMGRQYGYLLRGELRRFLDEITADIAQRGIPYPQQVELARDFASYYATEITELMAGIGETSGLSADEVMLANASMMLLTQAVLGGAPPSACSALAAWGSYTPDGRLVIGRNWDIDRASMKQYMTYLGIVVLHPDTGLAVANIHPIGNLYLETGMNEKGLFIELNNGEQSDPGFNEIAEDSSSVLLRVLSASATLDDAYTTLCATPADLAYIIQIADSSRAVSVERATFDCRRVDGKNEGVLAAYNSFVPPYPLAWEAYITPPPPVEEDPRLANLYQLADSPEYKGHLDVEGMKRLMDVPVEEGGAMHAGTVFQVIAQPETRTIWLRGVEFSDWEKVDLASLFL